MVRPSRGEAMPRRGPVTGAGADDPPRSAAGADAPAVGTVRAAGHPAAARGPEELPGAVALAASLPRTASQAFGRHNAELPLEYVGRWGRAYSEETLTPF